MSEIVSVDVGRSPSGFLAFECRLANGEDRTYVLVTNREFEMFTFMRDMARMGLDEEFFRFNPTPTQIADAMLGREVE